MGAACAGGCPRRDIGRGTFRPVTALPPGIVRQWYLVRFRIAGDALKGDTQLLMRNQGVTHRLS
jgi:hypothetical protein